MRLSTISLTRSGARKARKSSVLMESHIDDLDSTPIVASCRVIRWHDNFCTSKGIRAVTAAQVREESSLRQRLFGRTGWMVSEIGFGAWAIGASWGPVKDDDSLDALRVSLDEGVDFLDTADVYGDHASEQLI